VRLAISNALIRSVIALFDRGTPKKFDATARLIFGSVWNSPQSAYLGRRQSLADYIGWMAANFDPSIGWRECEWIHDFWKGKLLIKGILDPEDARNAVRFGADGIVVSNHGGRQLEGCSRRRGPCLRSSMPSATI
jgi:isopentenyl diphosphate isomerase/L-lactate dehydrogenase-like FMN-dependent dehydrogenase